MAYVAPTWKDGGPPALNAAALQAISDAIVGAESKNASQDSLISALQATVGGKGQIEVGSYVGTGTYGETKPCSITLSFVPKLIWFFGLNGSRLSGTTYPTVEPTYKNEYSLLLLPMSVFSSSYTRGYGPVYITQSSDYTQSTNSYAKLSGNTFSWYHAYSAAYQLNLSGKTWYWAAFG